MIEKSRVAVLETGIELTTGSRKADYGDFMENMQRAADIFYSTTGIRLTPNQVCLFMVAMKLSRIYVSPEKDDHYVDMAVYGAAAYECLKATSTKSTKD